MMGSKHRQLWRDILRILVITVTYVATAKLGLAFAILPGSVTAVWAPSGIAVACVLLWGYRVLPGVWLGATLAGVLTASPPTAMMFGIGNTTEAALCAYLFHRLINTQHSFVRTRDVLEAV
ncbi:MAG: MASE1 domain-containing protein [Armatimonadota bacterium]